MLFNIVLIRLRRHLHQYHQYHPQLQLRRKLDRFIILLIIDNLFLTHHLLLQLVVNQ